MDSIAGAAWNGCRDLVPAFLEIDSEHVAATEFTGNIGVPHDLVRRDALVAPQVDHGSQIDPIQSNSSRRHLDCWRRAAVN